MIISDAHKGLVKAIKEIFVNVIWQRCQVHFLRNILSKAPKKNTEEFRTDIKALFKIQDINLARKMKEEIFLKYENEKKFQNSLNTLDEGFEDAFAYLANDAIHSRLRSTNYLERLNQEVRRREKVIRIFPNEDSAIRLIISPSANRVGGKWWIHLSTSHTTVHTVPYTAVLKFNSNLIQFSFGISFWSQSFHDYVQLPYLRFPSYFLVVWLLFFSTIYVIGCFLHKFIPPLVPSFLENYFLVLWLLLTSHSSLLLLSRLWDLLG